MLKPATEGSGVGVGVGTGDGLGEGKELDEGDGLAEGARLGTAAVLGAATPYPSAAPAARAMTTATTSPSQLGLPEPGGAPSNLRPISSCSAPAEDGCALPWLLTVLPLTSRGQVTPGGNADVELRETSRAGSSLVDRLAEALPLESGQPPSVLEVVTWIGRHTSTSKTDQARPAGQIPSAMARGISISALIERRVALMVDVKEVHPTVAMLPGGSGRLGGIGFEHAFVR